MKMHFPFDVGTSQLPVLSAPLSLIFSPFFSQADWK